MSQLVNAKEKLDRFKDAKSAVEQELSKELQQRKGVEDTNRDLRKQLADQSDLWEENGRLSKELTRAEDTIGDLRRQLKDQSNDWWRDSDWLNKQLTYAWDESGQLRAQLSHAEEESGKLRAQLHGAEANLAAAQRQK
eukprot:CAMPEP_0115540768 /NCGR_PEP_ID=MMETSP0271-20121206/90113_1 /TAXON_ID=71861 /ORGANISM="Scrippsiella trochoidea, Strain CCMP3099" /LENGTH=137 /DNA_ID=CAMNT_0002973803 /DNA_START=112 /DNA_END=522 /DNA_ORIENTATION=-